MLKKYAILLDPTPDAGGGAPAPESAGGSSGMADSIMAELNTVAAPAPEPTSAPTPEPAKPAPAPSKPAEPVKPAAPVTAKPTPAPAKPAAPAPAEKPLDWKTAPANFRAAHDKLQQVFETQTRELQTKLHATEGQMRELQQREYLTPEQKQQYARMQERQQQLESDLYARDFRESPAFKEKYDSKARKVWTSIQAELKGLQVTENGEQRAATVRDFQKVQSSNESLAQQRRIAREMFGDDADVVLKFAGELSAIEAAANEEIDSHRANYQKERDAAGQRQQQEQQTGLKAYNEFDQKLAEKYFQPISDNPDYNKALEEGLKFVDSNSTQFSTKTPEQRAQTAAIVRRMAAAWPAAQTLITQKDARITELEAQIAKLQGSDPGNGGDGGAPAAAEEGSGTDALSAEIERLQRQG